MPIEPLHELFVSCHQRLVSQVRRDLRLEIEPGRYYVAPGCTLVARVTDVKYDVPVSDKMFEPPSAGGDAAAPAAKDKPKSKAKSKKP